MKKLILYDHLGNKLLEQDVFVDGQDFKYEAPYPTAIWLGKLMIVDKEPESEPKAEISKEQLVSDHITLEEVKVNELKEIDNQSARDIGSGEASEHESLEGLSKEATESKPDKRDKHTRKR